MRVAEAQDFIGVVLSFCALKKIISYNSMFHRTLLGVPDLLIILFLASTDNTHFTTADWNQEYPLHHFAGRNAVWPSG